MKLGEYVPVCRSAFGLPYAFLVGGEFYRGLLSTSRNFHQATQPADFFSRGGQKEAPKEAHGLTMLSKYPSACASAYGNDFKRLDINPPRDVHNKVPFPKVQWSPCSSNGTWVFSENNHPVCRPSLLEHPECLLFTSGLLPTTSSWPNFGVHEHTVSESAPDFAHPTLSYNIIFGGDALMHHQQI